MKTLIVSQDGFRCGWEWVPRPTEDEEQAIIQIVALRKTRVKDKSTLYLLYKVEDESCFMKITKAAYSQEAWEI